MTDDNDDAYDPFNDPRVRCVALLGYQDNAATDSSTLHLVQREVKETEDANVIAQGLFIAFAVEYRSLPALLLLFDCNMAPDAVAQQFHRIERGEASTDLAAWAPVVGLYNPAVAFLLVRVGPGSSRMRVATPQEPPPAARDFAALFGVNTPPGDG